MQWIEEAVTTSDHLPRARRLTAVRNATEKASDQLPGNRALWVYSAMAGCVSFGIGLGVAALTGIESGPLRAVVIGTTVTAVSVAAGLAAEAVLRQLHPELRGPRPRPVVESEDPRSRNRRST